MDLSYIDPSKGTKLLLQVTEAIINQAGNAHAYILARTHWHARAHARLHKHCQK